MNALGTVDPLSCPAHRLAGTLDPVRDPQAASARVVCPWASVSPELPRLQPR